MKNYDLDKDEVIIFEEPISYEARLNRDKFTLTSKRMIIEHENGILKKELELIDIIPLKNVKVFNGKVQSKQKKEQVQVQTIDKNITLYFSGIIDATKVNLKIIDLVSGTSIAKRGSNKIKDAIDLVDDTIGIDTKDVVVDLLTAGIGTTIIHGLRNKKKK